MFALLLVFTLSQAPFGIWHLFRKRKLLLYHCHLSQPCQWGPASGIGLFYPLGLQRPWQLAMNPLSLSGPTSVAFSVLWKIQGGEGRWVGEVGSAFPQPWEYKLLQY